MKKILTLFFMCGFLVLFADSKTNNADKTSNITLTEEQKTQLRSFKFVTEVANKYTPPVKTYEQMFAEWASEKLLSENPGTNKTLTLAIGTMIAEPRKIVKVPVKFLNGTGYLEEYYQALLSLADNEKREAITVLFALSKESGFPAASYTKYFVIRSLHQARKWRRDKKQMRAIFEKILLAHPVSRKEATINYRLIYDLGENFLIKIATKTKNLEKFDKWFRLILTGHAGIKEAWQARGSGWSSSVTEEGWKGFRIGLKKAENALVKAWRLAPDKVEAPALMIAVSMGQDKSVEERILWFKRAIEAQLVYYSAFSSIANATAPKWGGSWKLLMNLAIACLKSPCETVTPRIGINTLIYAGKEFPDYRWQLVFTNLKINAALDKYIDSKLKTAKTSDEKNRAAALKILTDVYTLDYDSAAVTLKKLTPAVFRKELEAMRKQRASVVIDWQDPEKLIFTFSGNNSAELCRLQKLYLSGKRLDAMSGLMNLIIAGKLSAKKKQAAADFFARIMLNKPARRYPYYGSSPLNLALGIKTKPVWIRTMINMGIDCNVLMRDSKRTSLMQTAFRNPQPEWADMLVKHGVNINQRDKYKWTALEYAVRKDHYEFAQRLIKLGAKMNTTDNTGNSLLLRAFLWKRYKMVDLLVSSGANINIINRGSLNLLQEAVAKKFSIDVIRNILKYKFNPKYRSKYGGTALNYAAQFHPDPKVLKLLLENGYEVDNGDKDDDTSLCAVAAWTRKPVEKIKILLKAGADINHRNRSGRTPLIMAVISRKDDAVIKLLVDNGALLDIKDNSGRTAYDWAVKKNKTAFAKYLKAKAR